MEVYENRIELLRQGILPPGGIVAEVGVCRGEFSRYIWDIAKPSVLHLIDLWADIGAMGSRGDADAKQCENHSAVMAQAWLHIKGGRVVLHQGRSDVVLASFEPGLFAWIYQDAGHDEQSVLGDLMVAERLTDIIAVHDYTEPGEVDPSDYAPNQHEEYRLIDGPRGIESKILYWYPGVYKGVMTFCEKCGWERIARTKMGPYAGEDVAGSNAPTVVLRRK